MFLEVKDAEKYYGEKYNLTKVLNKVSFSVESGKICAILGPSGSGKSTLLNVIGALESLDRGEIVVGGQNISSMDNDELTVCRREMLGFVFQFYNLMRFFPDRRHPGRDTYGDK